MQVFWISKNSLRRLSANYQTIKMNLTAHEWNDSVPSVYSVGFGRILVFWISQKLAFGKYINQSKLTLLRMSEVTLILDFHGDFIEWACIYCIIVTVIVIEYMSYFMFGIRVAFRCAYDIYVLFYSIVKYVYYFTFSLGVLFQVRFRLVTIFTTSCLSLFTPRTGTINHGLKHAVLIFLILLNLFNNSIAGM